MRVLSIGYGRHVFDQDNFEYERLTRLSAEVESLDHIIFSKKSHGLEQLQIGSSTFHPTNSFSKLTMLLDAIVLGQVLIRRKNITVISTQDPFETGFVGLVLKILNPKVALQVQEHGDVLSSRHWREEKFSNQIRSWFAFRILKRADIVRVVSKRTERFLEKELGSGKKIKRLPVVVDMGAFNQQSRQFSTNDEAFTFLTAARFVPQKNFSLMLRAFAEVHQTHKNVRLMVYGSGPLESNLHNLISELQIQEVVSVSGWTDSLPDAMSRANAYLLTSNYEGWARVLIEALVNRLPIVTTDVGCVGEVVQQNEHGLVVPVDDRESLVKAMKKMVSDHDFYSSIQNNLQALEVASLPGTDLSLYAKQWVETLR